MRTVVVMVSVLFLLLWSGVANSSLINGGFEAGDFTGWTLYDPGGSSVEESNSIYTAYEGNYFARLFGSQSDTTYLSQQIDLTAGETTSGVARYYADFPLEAGAAVRIYDSLGIPTTLWEISTNVGDAPPFLTDWQIWSWTAPLNASYNLKLEVFWDSSGYPWTPPIAYLDAVPIPGAIWLFGTGLLGLGAVGWRRRRKG